MKHNMDISTNPKKRLAALMVYLELKECTDPDTFIDSRTLSKRLEDKYGRENRPSHNTVAAILKDMKECSELLDIDVRRGNSRQGYCLAEREFSEWEINLFAETVLNSKTLSAIDKKNLIDKLYNHLGSVSDQKINAVYDLLFSNKKKNKKKDTRAKQDKEDTLTDLSYAISKNRQVEVFVNEQSIQPSKVATIRFKRTIHPYRIFEKNHSSYLVYGRIVLDRLLVFYNRIDDIEVLSVKKDKIHPIENARGFEKGLDEKKLRKDPFGYITKSDGDTVIAEAIIKDEKAMMISKQEVELEFGDSVSFYRDKDSEYLYINDDFEKCLHWFLLHSSEYRVISPESFVDLLRIHTTNMYKTYGGSSLDTSKYKDEQTPIKYMYKNKRSYVTHKNKK